MTKVARGPIVKSASLDTILKANGQKTTDEHRAEYQNTAQQLLAVSGVYMNSARRKSLRRTMKKAGKDIFGNPLPGEVNDNQP